MIKLSRIVFEGPIQIASMTIREYQLGEPGAISVGYAAHLHPEFQCVILRSQTSDTSILIPLRCVRAMEVAQREASEPVQREASEPEHPRRGRPRTKQLNVDDTSV